MINVAIIQFPGTNCEHDTFKWLKEDPEFNPILVWHKETSLPLLTNFIILPGGFAYGDRKYDNATDINWTMDPGAMAANSPIMEAVQNHHASILGICNGFQILTHIGLLPGKLIRNDCERFICGTVSCEHVNPNPFMGVEHYYPSLPIAHGYGRYVRNENDPPIRQWLTYRTNPNGSQMNTAGICVEQSYRRIYGMMPHPERAQGQTRIDFRNGIKAFAGI